MYDETTWTGQLPYSITVWNAVYTYSGDSSVEHDSRLLYVFILIIFSILQNN